MTKEFLLQCEKKIEEAYKCAATDQGDKVNDIVREVSRDILLKISDSVTPVSEGTLPLRYNNDKQKKPLFSRGLSVCRLLFNSFSKLKIDENYKEKRRLFY